jgi:hypothetical protein
VKSSNTVGPTVNGLISDYFKPPKCEQYLSIIAIHVTNFGLLAGPHNTVMYLENSSSHEFDPEISTRGYLLAKSHVHC